MNGKMLATLVAAFAPFLAEASTPVNTTPISASFIGTMSSGPNTYHCYDFGNYIKPADSPVIGGWVTAAVDYIAPGKGLSGGENMYGQATVHAPFGIACLSLPFDPISATHDGKYVALTLETTSGMSAGYATVGSTTKWAIFGGISSSSSSYNLVVGDVVWSSTKSMLFPGTTQFVTDKNITCSANAAIIQARNYKRGDIGVPYIPGAKQFSSKAEQAILYGYDFTPLGNGLVTLGGSTLIDGAANVQGGSLCVETDQK